MALRLQLLAMMQRLIALVIAVSATGCAARDACDGPHEVVSSSGDAPGTLRAGVRFQSAYPALASLSDGSVVCLTCTSFVKLDAELHTTAEAGGPAYTIAAGPDDTIYATLADPDYRSSGPMKLTAFEPSGELRWAIPLTSALRGRPMFAVSDGLYVAPSEAGQVTTFFEAATGAAHAFPATGVLAADDHSVFARPIAWRATSVTIQRLDPTGAALWERTWSSAMPELVVETAAALPDGGVIILGNTRDAVDFGDRTLSGKPSAFFEFLVGVAPDGATQWAYVLDGLRPDRLVLAPSGGVLLAGESFPLSSDDPSDAFLAVASATGIERMFRVDGAAEQRIEGLSVSPDGVAHLLVVNSPREGEDRAAMHFAGHHFIDPGVYVFSIVL